jgi:hypothetical protein
MKLLEWLMLGLHLFTPKCILREDIHFKSKHKIYITKNFEDERQEMWCMDYKQKDKLRSDFKLGNFALRVWTKPRNFHNLPWDVQKGAIRLHQLLMSKIDEKDKGVDTGQVMKKNKKEKREYTREDFVRFGKMGPKVVMEKLGKFPGQIRWEKEKELSTDR